MAIIFAAISPHPPILLPDVGAEKDRLSVKNTIEALKNLGEKFAEAKPDSVIISAPHPDWGIKVPLHFLISKFKNQNSKLSFDKLMMVSEVEPQFKIQNYQKPYDNIVIGPSNDFMIYPVLTVFDSPQRHYEWGKELYSKIKTLRLKIALIASGDMSHCLKADGPYGFHPDGPKFDKTFIEALKKKDIGAILKLDEKYPDAAECGLRSFCFLLGILEGAKINWQPKILSYEAPFGVGYLVADFKLNNLIDKR